MKKLEELFKDFIVKNVENSKEHSLSWKLNEHWSDIFEEDADKIFIKSLEGSLLKLETLNSAYLHKFYMKIPIYKMKIRRELNLDLEIKIFLR